MKSNIAERIMATTPEETKRFVRKYGDIVVRVHQILKEKGITQKMLADKMGKTPSEISKWLSGEHNFTLRSITKLETELGEDLIYIPKKDSFHVQIGRVLKAKADKATPVSTRVQFQEAGNSVPPTSEPMAA
jgi:transcriptional regulator with XRE-family HTH domain